MRYHIGFDCGHVRDFRPWGKMAVDSIQVKGAREHNLKGIDVSIPRNKLVVITGLSGSGKSSLAFDTIYAEGQRRYVESLSAYARQFLEQMRKPDVDYIEGLPPTISIEQRSSGATPRSTVATTTEIYDYLRLLYARVGLPHCPSCGRKITQQTCDQIVTQVLRHPERTPVMILAPVVRGRKGEHREVLASIVREGFVRARVDGQVAEVRELTRLKKSKKHSIEIVVDRIVLKEGVRSRLAESIELALRLGSGIATVSYQNGTRWRDATYSEHYACSDCGISIGELEPRMFSFNSPYGACPTCDGLGTRLEFDEDLIVPDKDRSLQDGAVEPWSRGGRRMAFFHSQALGEFARRFDVDLKVPYRSLARQVRKALLYGADTDGRHFPGVIPSLVKRFEQTSSEHVKTRLLSYMSEQYCSECAGARLRPESRSVKVGTMTISEVTRLSIARALELFKNLSLTKEKQVIGRQIVKEICQRLSFLVDVGLSYLTLDRTSSTLSGGEAQRIRLATQVGSGLVGVCYVLDEPTIGLHQRDNAKLIRTLTQLRDAGNTVIVVEHDEDTIRSADYVVDLGPGAGERGGRVIAAGGLDEILEKRESLTASYLRGSLQIRVPALRRPAKPKSCLLVRRASENNLKHIDVRFPTGVFTCVTGVSGSGKSTLVSQILLAALRRKLYGSREKPGAHKALEGAEEVDKVIEIDQSPIGRTPRSNAATYTGVFTHIRQLFTRTKEAKIRGYSGSRFSFNVKGGRCESCQGQGTKKIEMHFLPDLYVTCEECKGKRYNRETLQITYKGRNIADVLDMRVEDALHFFANFRQIQRILQTLVDVGLGYIALGQPSTTLSGGEAQRVKLSAELGKMSTGRTVYILDEPTTGLHFADIDNLLGVLNRLADMGNTIIVIEHNIHVIKCADWIIDLGPGGGDDGGTVVSEGTPEDVARDPKSFTGQYLAHILQPPATAAKVRARAQ